MPMRSVRVENVTVFQRSGGMGDAFEMSFSDGINVLIGENGIGKTALLKMIYAAAQWSVREPEPGRRGNLARYFSFHLWDRDLLPDSDCTDRDSGFSVSVGERTVSYSLTATRLPAWRIGAGATCHLSLSPHLRCSPTPRACWRSIRSTPIWGSIRQRWTSW